MKRFFRFNVRFNYRYSPLQRTASTPLQHPDAKFPFLYLNPRGISG
jgi:hypothetical protein